MNNTEERKLTQDFIARWTGRGYEKGESQSFWLDLLATLGVESPTDFIRFENQVHLDHTSFIDGFIESTHVLIEQKSLGKDLRSPIRQSDGTLLTPFQQAKRYSAELPYSERPRWIVTCNFAEFLVYDMEQPNGEPASILLKDLEKERYRLSFLFKTQDAALQREMEISLAAGDLVGRLYDALLAQYLDPASEHSLKSLNALCVRLVFCLYAEDAGLFPSHTAFHDYLASFHPDNVRKALIDLFRMLDTKPEERDPYERPELLAFPYVNGGLFRDEHIEVPRFTSEILYLILKDCSADFDWSGISPTIFGAVFESTLNPETRRGGGMHYTSIENIHKVIDPLFLDDLTDSFTSIAKIPQPKQRNAALLAFQDKLASLRFLDPACGSGNFLTETFLSLRRLENKVLKLLRGDSQQMALGGDFSPIKVGIGQFYGIEINDFAATVAKTALWIAESQMMRETEDIVGRDLDFLPLKTYTNITEGNALRLDWREVLGHGAATLLSPTNNAGRQECRPSMPHTSTPFLNRDEPLRQHKQGNLPHWHQDDKMQFITFRLADSMPQAVLDDLMREKDEWLSLHPQPWDKATETEYYDRIASKADKWLDAGHGSCLLRDPQAAAIVEECLRHYDGVQYELVAYVVMPNHVHVLVRILPGHDTATIVKAWKGVSARQINAALGFAGELWQKEYFDRIIRSEWHLQHTIAYIEQNYAHGGATLLSPANARGAATLLSPTNKVWRHGAATLLSPTNNAGRQECRPSMPLYIMGNPPFVGARLMSKAQKEDMINVFGAKWRNVGNMDYVSCWYKKAADLIRGTGIHCALVSTNSITQGEQVPNLWKPLMAGGIRIDFAHRTFRWDSEAKLKAHVHCVIVGFSWHGAATLLSPTNNAGRHGAATLLSPTNDTGRHGAATLLSPTNNAGRHGAATLLSPTNDAGRQECRPSTSPTNNAGRQECRPSIIYDGGTRTEARHINAYLIDAPDVFVESRQRPLCPVPEIGIGNKPIDGGQYLFTREEMEAFVRREPRSARYFRPWYGAEEFIHRRPRFCLWLGGCTPAEINAMPECRRRVQAVRGLRLASKSEGTRKLADRPTRFHVENMPDTNYIIIPETSSERRRYIPIGFLTPNELCSNALRLIPSATLYHFGVLTSNVHMAWTRAVCGRLEMRYRYSKDVVYNNFPWPVEGLRSCRPASLAGDVEGRHSCRPASIAGDVEGRHSCRPASIAGDKSVASPCVAAIKQTAQAILDARALYPDSSLADLYDETTMPPELRKAHQANDRAVMQAYGFPIKGFTESDCVAALMRMYQELT